MTATRAPWVGLELENGRYHVLGLLGEGGMASIFKATDRQKNKEVVLKVPKPALLADPEFTHRFAREIRTLVELKHPSVVAVYGFGRHEGVPFAVLEYLSGGTLADQPKPCQPKDLGAWLPDVAAALDHIHKAGYVHRDVKPGNILFDANGRPRLADFGIIKSINEKAAQQTMALTESGVTVGTPEYMAPELAKGHSFDGRVDQYALAVTVYERLSGRRPIEGGTGPVILVKHIREKPKPLDEVAEVPQALAEVVGKALAKDPKARFASCFDFARAVMNPNRAITPTATKTPSTKGPVTTRQPLAYEATTDRASWVLPAAIGGGVLALALFALLGWLILRPTPAPANAAPVAKLPIDDVPRPAPADDAPFKLGGPASVKVALGSRCSVPITVQRRAGWTGEVSVAVMPSSDGVTGEPNKPLDQGTDQTTARFHLAANATAKSIKVVGSGNQFVCDLTIPLEIVTPQYSIADIDDVELVGNREASVTIRFDRNGWEDDIVLNWDKPPGIILMPPFFRLPKGASEMTVRIHANSPQAQSGQVRLMSPTQEEKVRFNVRVAESATTNSGKQKMVPRPREEIGTLVGRHATEISNIVFSPRDPGTLIVWDQSHMSVWDAPTKQHAVNKLLEGALMRGGTVSPDGKRILTATKTKIYVHDPQGKEIQSGPNKYRILGTYFDSTSTGFSPYFWTPSGLCNTRLQVVQPGSTSASLIRYATAGSSIKLADTDGRVKMSGKKNVSFSPSKPSDFAVSHDGRWVAIASNGRVLLYDTDAAEPAATVWEKDVASVTALAVSPDGKTLALGIGKDLRLLNVTSQE